MKIEDLKNSGYQVLVTTRKNYDIKNNEMVSVYLNEVENDFKVVLEKNDKNMNIEILDYKNLDEKLSQNHPILNVVKKLNTIKKNEDGIKNMEFKPKKIKN